MRHELCLNRLKWFSIIFLMFFTQLAHGQVEETGIDIFKAHDPNSEITINYKNLTSLLKATVVRARM
ncbi:hypothetical protein MNBD_ALPHA01-207, partial [hydrothermal vent metagenome]